MTYSKEITIERRKIGWAHPTYFIADLGANHDGDLERAKDLIYLAKESGADVAKFQHFKADTIVSDFGFKSLSLSSHQSGWKKSVFEVYKDASVSLEWTQSVKATCDKAGITFMTSPYSFELIDHVDPYVPAYKVGSGDITWPQIIAHMAQKRKPIMLACGASEQKEVDAAIASLAAHTQDIVLMQCNTNYTASRENFKYINLNVLNTFKAKYPGLILGLSDHTPGHATVLGAVTLGARVVEKHFTDDNDREGPDHKFAMNPKTWREMVERTRELEYALGDGIKRVEENEKETVVVQRRSIRVNKNVAQGSVIGDGDIEVLRPAPVDGFSPAQVAQVLGKRAKRNITKGDYIKTSDL